MLLIQKTLSDLNPTIEQIKNQEISILNDSGIDYHLEKDKYLHLDYSIGASKTSKLVKECRGIVLEIKKWNIIRYGFDRFMNYGESGQDPIDFKRTVFYDDKLDGSLIFLHYLPREWDMETQSRGKWNVGTRGRVFPDSNVQGFDFTFVDLFWRIFGKDQIPYLNKGICYLFELCALENRIVIGHKKSKTPLIGARWIENWRELDGAELNAEASRLNVERPEFFTFESLGDVLSYTETLNGNQQEGFVAKQFDGQNWIRAKIKSPSYLALHQIFSVKSVNSIVRLVLLGKRNILTEDFQEYLRAYDLIDSLFNNFLENCEKVFEANRAIMEDGSLNLDFKQRRKQFAMNVMKEDSNIGHYCFARIDGKYNSPKDYLKTFDCNVGIKKLIERFNIKKILGQGWQIVEDVDNDI